jgi:hypothetical protein
MHKSALPVSVRGALNDAAFNAKTKFIPREFDENFTQRKKNFISSHTAFNRSPNTFNINKMVSEAGVIKGKSEAGDNLEKQEFGGTIKNREYIPMDAARVGKNKTKLVSKRFYIKNIKPQRSKRRSQNQQFIRAAFKAGKGGFVRYDDFLFSIRSIKKQKGDKLFIKADPVYSFKENRSVSISKAPFIWPAGLEAAKMIPEFFVKQAERRINK